MSTQNPHSFAIEPWLTVYNGEKAVAFYKQAFAAVEVYRMETPDGGLVVKLSVNGASFWVSCEGGDDKEDNQQTVSGHSLRMILRVLDPDAVYNQAIEAGAVSVFPVGESVGD